MKCFTRRFLNCIFLQYDLRSKCIEVKEIKEQTKNLYVMIVWHTKIKWSFSTMIERPFFPLLRLINLLMLRSLHTHNYFYFFYFHKVTFFHLTHLQPNKKFINSFETNNWIAFDAKGTAKEQQTIKNRLFWRRWKKNWSR